MSFRDQQLLEYQDATEKAGHFLQRVSFTDVGSRAVFRDSTNHVWMDQATGHVAYTGKSVLSVGCNTGYDLLLAMKAGADFVEGLELVPEVAAIASAVMMRSAAPATWRVRTGSIEERTDLQLFDIVSMPGVLYHLENPMLGLRNCFRALKPGGWFVLKTMIWNEAIPGPSLIFYAQDEELPDHYKYNWPKFFMPSITAVEHMLAEVGFTEIQSFMEGRGCYVARRPQE